MTDYIGQRAAGYTYSMKAPASPIPRIDQGSEAFAQFWKLVAVAGVVLELVGLAAFGAVAAVAQGEIGEVARAEVRERHAAARAVGVASNVPQQAEAQEESALPQQREEPR